MFESHSTVSLYIAILIILWSQHFNYGQYYEKDSGYIRLQSEIDLVLWDLQDECSQIATSMRNFYLDFPNGLADKITMETNHANFLKTHAGKLGRYNRDDIPLNLFRKWTLLTKCGDFLLSKEEFKARNVFRNINLVSIYSDRPNLNNCTLNMQDVYDKLATVRNITELKEIWDVWYQKTQDYVQWYGAALSFSNKAAELNDCDDAKNYWEMLTTVPEGYNMADELWTAVEPLYRKLHEFVRVRVNNHYNTSYETDLPPFVLGSFLGDDFSSIADIVLPNPQLYYDLKVEVDARRVEDYYKNAEQTLKKLRLPLLGKRFYANSDFNYKFCEPKILNYCNEQYSSILTCNQSTISNYLLSQETAIRIALQKLNVNSLVLLSLRNSPLVEAVASLGSLLAFNQFPQWDILSPKSYYTNEENRMTALLLIALKVLPKIAYFHTADQFRLAELADDQKEANSAAKSWSSFRKSVQGLATENEETSSEFLRDETILKNQPYLHKFFGQFIQFQLLSRQQIDLLSEVDAPKAFIGEDVTTFHDFLHSFADKDALDSLAYYYNINEINADDLIAFFEPLEDYLDNAPLKQAKFTIKKAKVTSKKLQQDHLLVQSTTAKAVNKMKDVKKLANKNEEILENRENTKKAEIIKQQNEEELIQNGTNSTKIAGFSTNQEFNEENSNVPWDTVHIGIYLGVGIVAITFLVLITGFIMQRRRLQASRRNYNA